MRYEQWECDKCLGVFLTYASGAEPRDCPWCLCVPGTRNPKRLRSMGRVWLNEVDEEPPEDDDVPAATKAPMRVRR